MSDSDKNKEYYSSKADKGKNLVGLFCEDFANALLAAGEVSEYGLRKYAKSTWKDVPDGLQRYRWAFMRHYNAYLRGEKIDEESGCPHLAHALWCLSAIFELDLKDKTDVNSTSRMPSNTSYDVTVQIPRRWWY